MGFCKNTGKKGLVFAIAGIGLVAVAAAAFFLWPRPAKDPATDDLLYVKEDALYRVDPDTGKTEFIADYDTYQTPKDAETYGGVKFPGAEILSSYTSYGFPVRFSGNGAFTYIQTGQTSLDAAPVLYSCAKGEAPEQIDGWDQWDSTYYITDNGRYTFAGNMLINNDTGDIQELPNLYSMNFFKDPHKYQGGSGKYIYDPYVAFGNTVFFESEDGFCRLTFGKEPEVIEENTSNNFSYYPASKDLVYYTSEGILYRWEKGKTKQIAENVQEIICAFPNGHVYCNGGLYKLTLAQSLGEEPVPEYLEGSPTLCYYNGEEFEELSEGAFKLLCASPDQPFAVLTNVQAPAIIPKNTCTVLIQKNTCTVLDMQATDAVYQGSDIYLDTADGLYKLSIDSSTISKPELVVEGDVTLFKNRNEQIIYAADNILYCNGQQIGRYDELPRIVSVPNAYGVVFHRDVEPIDDQFDTYGTRFTSKYTLYAAIDGEAVKIDDNVSFEYYLEDGGILYLKDIDEDTYSCDLYLWRDGEATKLDEDVHALIPNR